MKYLKMLWMMSLMVAVLGMNVAYGENLAANATVSDTYTLSHVVARISTFTTKTLGTTINNGDNIIGKFEIENNTIDGYKVQIKSLQGGVLAPAADGDGEEDIDYTLVVQKINGELGEGLALTSTVVFAQPNLNEDIIELTGELKQVSPTDVSYKLVVSVDAAEAMTMAGSYSDTITLTYTDL
jgi:hypothetical protein